MEYPRKIYKNVLLYDGKIVNWKTGTQHWNCVERAFHNRQPLWLINTKHNKITVNSEFRIVNNSDENYKYFNDETFYRKYEIHEKFSKHMFNPY